MWAGFGVWFVRWTELFVACRRVEDEGSLERVRVQRMFEVVPRFRVMF